MKTQALPPFLKYLQETHRAHFRLQKRQTIKAAKKVRKPKRRRTFFCFRTHPFRFSAYFCKSRIWLGRGRQPVRRNTFNRYALGTHRSRTRSAPTPFSDFFAFLGLWRIQSELCASFSARSAVMSDSTISSIAPLRKDSMAYSVSPMRWSVTRPCGKL